MSLNSKTAPAYFFSVWLQTRHKKPFSISLFTATEPLPSQRNNLQISKAITIQSPETTTSNHCSLSSSTIHINQPPINHSQRNHGSHQSVPISPIHSHDHFTTTSPQSQIHHHPINYSGHQIWATTSLYSCSSHCRQAKRTTLKSHKQSITAPKLHSLCRSVPPSSHEVHADITSRPPPVFLLKHRHCRAQFTKS